MIARLRSASVLTLTLACASGGSVRAAEEKPRVERRRAPSQRPARPRDRVLVSGRAQTLQALQCGGVRAREDEPAFRASALSERFLVRRGALNSEAAVVATVSTRAGKFSVHLPGAGRYCVIRAHQRTRPRARGGQHAARVSGVDAECLRARWERCVAIWEVGPRGLADARIDVYQSCRGDNPCYRHGSPPP